MDIELNWEKVDSHVEDKKSQGKKDIKGNPLAWRLNSAADDMAGKERVKILYPPEEVFFQNLRLWWNVKGQ